MTSSGARLCLLLMLAMAAQSCCGFGGYVFDMHHRYSDPVRGILGVDELPEKGSLQYYAAMSKRDRIIHGRNLAAENEQTPVTFVDGNATYQYNGLGFLYYANVSVGTPSLSYLVALDTGSDLFWLPCDCTSCVHGLRSSTGVEIDFNIYSPNTSSTSTSVPCNSTMCTQQRQCSLARDECPYQIHYLSNGTSSTGILVEDVLHLRTDSNQSKVVDAKITLGCGKVQTGSFLDGAAPNGLFGLGMTNVSVPSILANEGLAANSFSMCFGDDGIGRISFGDQGSSDQGETPFNIRQSHPTYNISVTKVTVGGSDGNVGFSAIFDSGTSFTYVNDPAYTYITGTFNSQVKEPRHSSDADIPFEFCYDLSSNQTSISVPIVNLTMQGGVEFNVNDPIFVTSVNEGYIYCLSILKSDDVNIIGQNFMTGYRVVFNREKMVLGWKASDCYNDMGSNIMPISPQSSAVPPSSTVNPEATSGNGNGSQVPSAPSPSAQSYSPKLNSFTWALFLVLLPLFAIFV